MCSHVKSEGKTLHVAQFMRFAFPDIRFGGFARRESLPYWKSKVVREHKVPVEGFAERTGPNSAKMFNKSGKMRILEIKSNGDKEVRIVTKPASPSVAKVHDREPELTE